MTLPTSFAPCSTYRGPPRTINAPRCSPSNKRPPDVSKVPLFLVVLESLFVMPNAIGSSTNDEGFLGFADMGIFRFTSCCSQTLEPGNEERILQQDQPVFLAWMIA